ncbi:MAG TPA: NAD(P)-binding oxidoreductase [Candidatus Saccharimonadales bacterium]|jgi:putative NADH-flavin reductase
MKGMTVTVFGASGKVGRLVVERLLERGVMVRAFIRSVESIEASDGLEIFTGDIYDAVAVAEALDGADAVISTLGSWGTPKQDILTVGMTHVIAPMQAANIDRLVSLTGAEARADGDDISLLHRVAHTAASLAAGKILTDGERHIELLAASTLDWTVLRSPVMRSGTTEVYHLTEKRPAPWDTIDRAAVAKAVVDQLEDRSFIAASPYVAR